MRKTVFIFTAAILCLLMLAGCALPEELRFVNPTESVVWEPTEPTATQPPMVTEPEATTPPAATLTAAEIAASMDVPRLIDQLFLVISPVDGATELLMEHHVGGIILYDQDIDGQTPDSLRNTLTDYQSRVPIPLLVAVEEEGGCVCTISRHPAFRSAPFHSAHKLYYEGGLFQLRETEAEKAQLLKRLGINVNLAPVCDVVSREDAFLADRALYQTPKTTGEAVAAMVKTMQKNGVGAVLKYFPGYGDLTGDAHTGKVVDDVRSQEHLQAYDYVPFRRGIEAEAGAVMMSHCIVNSIDETHPASLSEKVIHVLRADLGFDGVIITDDLTRDVVSEYYDEGEAAIHAILAGNDMLFTDWSDVRYNAICEAVEEGRISKDRLLESVTRIIQWKMDLGLL